MKTLITITFLLLFSVVQGQVDSIMFGLARGIATPSVPQSGYLRLGKVDPATASVTNISSASQGTALVAVNQTIDNRHNLYYFVNGSKQLVTMDLVTGNTLAAVTMTNPAADYFDLMSYHCADSTIYGLARGMVTPTIPSSGYVYLAKLNPITGSVTNISAVSIATSIVLSRTTIDSKNNIFYFINGASMLTGVDLATGTVVSSVAMTNSAAQHFGDLVYNRLDSTIYGIARGITTPSNPSTGYMYMARINPATGVVTNISSTSIGTSYHVGSTEIDPYNHVFYVVNGGNQLMTLGLASGTVQSSNAFTFSTGQYFDGMRYKHRVCTRPTGEFILLARLTGGGSATAIRESEKSDGISVFPNPAKAHLTITVDPLLYHHAKLVDLTGRVVMTQEITGNSVSLELADLADGVYTLVVTGDQKVISKQVMVSGR